jgi:hypothetical protein
MTDGANNTGSKTNKPRFNNKNTKGIGSSFKGPIDELKDHTFVYSQIKSKKWITSKKKFIEYAGTKYGGDADTTLDEGKITIVTFVMDAEPTDEEFTKWSQWKQQDYKQMRKDYGATKNKLQLNLSKLYTELWNQCDPQMQDIIAKDDDYIEARRKKDVLSLLKIIETICEIGDNQNVIKNKILGMRKVLNFRQSDDMTLGQYMEQFLAIVAIAERSKTEFGDKMMGQEAQKITKIKGVDGVRWDVLNNNTKQELKKEGRDMFLAMLFIMNSSETKYGLYKQECHNAMIEGTDKYPTTITKAHTVLSNYKCNTNLYQAKSKSPSYRSHQFVQEAATGSQDTDDTGRRLKKNLDGTYKCFNCDRMNKCTSFNCTEVKCEDGSPTKAESFGILFVMGRCCVRRSSNYLLRVICKENRQEVITHSKLHKPEVIDTQGRSELQ